MFLIHIVKPFVVIWAGLNVLDDISWGVKLARLIGASVPVPFLKERRFRSGPESSSSSENLCGLCDDVMEGMLRGSEGIQAVPCSWLCLRIPVCMEICSAIQQSADDTSKFPCSVAGYCSDLPPAGPAGASSGLVSQVECQRGPLWSCEPKQFCRRRFSKKRLQYTCEYRAGMGRWIQIQQTAASLTTAIASSLVRPKLCTEPDAGPYCIAEATGFGKVCEIFGWVLSLLYGGYQSILAIETPGGADDQQWLTFWLISVVVLVVERNFARVLLSKIPLYYETKLILIVWLMFFGGANQLYRKIRRKLMASSTFLAKKIDRQQGLASQDQLQAYICIGGPIISEQIEYFEKTLHQNPSTVSEKILPQQKMSHVKYDRCWEYDDTDDQRNGKVVNDTEILYLISKWILSVEGIQTLENAKGKIDHRIDDDVINMLMERAAAVVSFQPRYVNMMLIGTKPGQDGQLPRMDPNGKADCYVKCRLVTASSAPYPERGIRSKVVYSSLRPIWNETMEISLRKGTIDSFGNYISNRDARQTRLQIEAWDADVGFWGIAFDFLLLLEMGLAVISILGYVSGFLDAYLSSESVYIFGAANVAVALWLLLSYVLSKIFGADDEIIGNAEIPLEILLDQKEHSLLVHLQDSDPSNETQYTNGELGILRLKLSLSE